MSGLFDTHAHYTDEKLAGNDELLSSLFAGDVGRICTVAVDCDDAEQCIALAERYPAMVAAVGVYPGQTMRIENLESDIARLRVLAKSPKVVAIGEIGLDHHYDEPDREVQKDFFRAQMKLAEELSLPVVIHDREAHADVLTVLREFPAVRGIIHSYSGSAEMVPDFLACGYYLSFSGVVTFANAEKTRRAAEAVPLDRLLIETDAPYLAPVPMRGQTNHSGYVRYTAEKIAEIKGLDYETVVRATYENAKRIFHI